jgi:hypothetical protein
VKECSHTREVSGHWEDYCDDFTGESDDMWIDGYEESTTVDIDLHRYKCTQCNKVMYYSFRAKEYYEDGKTEHSGILGFDRK